MTTVSSSQVSIQTSPQSVPSTPPWLGEVVAFAQVLSHEGILKAIQEQVLFARARFGQYDTIDFVVVLLGYAMSGEPTLQSFIEPCGTPLSVLFSFQSSIYPASSSFLTRLMNRPSWMCSASAEMMRSWSREPKQSAMSPSMIQTVPCQIR